MGGKSGAASTSSSAFLPSPTSRGCVSLRLLAHPARSSSGPVLNPNPRVLSHVMGSTPWAAPLEQAHTICPRSLCLSTLHHPEAEGGTTTVRG